MDTRFLSDGDWEKRIDWLFSETMHLEARRELVADRTARVELCEQLTQQLAAAVQAQHDSEARLDGCLANAEAERRARLEAETREAGLRLALEALRKAYCPRGPVDDCRDCVAMKSACRQADAALAQPAGQGALYVRRLYGWVYEYGWHNEDCDDSTGGPCTCGLDELIEQGKAAGLGGNDG